MNNLYRIEKFVFDDDASADNLTGDEDRFVELFDASRNNSGSEGSTLDEDAVNRMLDNLHETQAYVVLDEDDEIAGVVAYDIDGSRVWLEGIATDRYRRSCGVGRFVMGWLVEVARENDCSKITGLSQPNSQTVDFYKKIGGYRDDTIAQANSKLVPMTIDVDLA